MKEKLLPKQPKMLWKKSMFSKYKFFIFVAILAFVFFMPLSVYCAPLAVHPTNPRYFVKDGVTVRLAGHEIFVDLYDNSWDHDYTYNYQTLLDWSWYLDFAQARNINYVRGWGGYFSTNDPNLVPPRVTPMPYLRVSGYGLANDGQNKFDLTQLNQAYFDRMRDRALSAQARGIYISLMLFEWHSMRSVWWNGNVFNSDNNINGIDAGSTAFFSSPSQAIIDLQRTYVRKVIDTVNDIDNIFYEIGNEIPNYSANAWQRSLISYIKAYEATKLKQHMVYMSWGPYVTPTDMINSGANVWAPGDNAGDYANNPPIFTGMPVIWDLDHTGTPRDNPSRKYVWTSFMRGYQYSLYDTPFEEPWSQSAAWENIRYNIGATNSYASRMALADMTPSASSSSCSTRYCLVNAGQEYLIYQPSSGAFTVSMVAGSYDYEWFDPATASIVLTGTVTATAGDNVYTPPPVISADAVLYLKLSAPVVVDEHYVTQSGAGNYSGDSCANAMPVTSFGSIIGFNSSTGTSYAGHTFYFGCDDVDITTTVNVQISGTGNGNEVVLDGYQTSECSPLTAECTQSVILTQGMNLGPVGYVTVQDFRMTRSIGDYAAALAGNNSAINHILFRRNYIHDTFASGFYLGNYFDYPVRSKYIIVEENVFKDHQMRSETTESSLFALSRWDHVLIRNNIFGHDHSEQTNCPSGCNNITIFANTDFLFEYNEVYGAPDQCGATAKELYTADSAQVRQVWRFNTFHDNNDANEGVGLAFGHSEPFNYLYIYGNMFAGNLMGMFPHRRIDGMHIWSNVFTYNGWNGVAIWEQYDKDLGALLPNNIRIFNNTFAYNGLWSPGHTDANKGGVSIYGGSGHIVKNNLFYNNREDGSGNWQIYDEKGSSLEHNTLWKDSGTATWYYAGAERTLNTMQTSYYLEDDLPAGTVSENLSTAFADPNGQDNTLGTVDDNYTLTTGSLTDGENFGSGCFDHNTMGANTVNLTNEDTWMIAHSGYSHYIEPCLDDGLDPRYTNFTTTPPTVITAKRSAYQWNRGAYVYIQPAHAY